jgi:hypothetical protein
MAGADELPEAVSEGTSMGLIGSEDEDSQAMRGHCLCSNLKQRNST